ncbi:MAG: hypothetical protein WCY51_01655 [Sulfurimonas sp.]
MKIIYYILSVPIVLNIILAIAILSVIVMDVFLKDIPEIVPWGYEFGYIYYKLCLSLFASYIFYFIVIHIKLERDKENVNVFISNKIFLIIGDYKSQIDAIKKETNTSIEKQYLNEIDIETMFQQLNPKGKAPLVLGNINNYANWMQYFSFYKDRTQKTIQKIFVHMPFLDSKLVKILAHIDDCEHFTVIELLSNMTFGNSDMKSFASSFYKYSMLCKELEDYGNKKMIKYKKS